VYPHGWHGQFLGNIVANGKETIEPRIGVEPFIAGATVCSSLKRFHFSDPFRDHHLYNLLGDINETEISTNISNILTYNTATFDSIYFILILLHATNNVAAV
jgi:hypothetical protein